MRALVAQRLTSQGLAGSLATTPLAVVQRLLAVQAQDPRAMRLSLRARSKGLSGADVDRELTDERSLVVTWLNRGTLHLVHSEDLPWLHALTTPALRRGNDRRLAQEGLESAAADRGVGAVVRALAQRGPLVRGDVRDVLERAGVPSARQALVHILLRASLEGLVVRGPVIGGEHAHVLARDWLGALAPGAGRVDRERALTELVRRALVGHAPASERDLAVWSGLPLRGIRSGLQAIAAELADRTDGLLALARSPPTADLPPPRLLGPFDPVLHGWTDRTWILRDRTDVVTRNGVFRAIALAEGHAVGTWTLPRGKVRLAPFGPLDQATREALTADAEDVERFLRPAD